MNQNEKFLILYRDLENTLRSHNMDYSTLENDTNNSDLKKNMLTITRQMRNFLSHNSDQKFLTISDAQIKMVESEIKTIKENDLTVDKRMIRLTNKLTLSSKISEALNYFGKNKTTIAPVFSLNRSGDVTGVYTVNIYNIIDEYSTARTKQLKNFVDKKNNFIEVERGTELKYVPDHDGKIVLIKNGEKYIGVLKEG